MISQKKAYFFPLLGVKINLVLASFSLFTAFDWPLLISEPIEKWYKITARDFSSTLLLKTQKSFLRIFCRFPPKMAKKCQKKVPSSSFYRSYQLPILFFLGFSRSEMSLFTDLSDIDNSIAGFWERLMSFLMDQIRNLQITG